MTKQMDDAQADIDRAAAEVAVLDKRTPTEAEAETHAAKLADARSRLETAQQRLKTATELWDEETLRAKVQSLKAEIEKMDQQTSNPTRAAALRNDFIDACERLALIDWQNGDKYTDYESPHHRFRHNDRNDGTDPLRPKDPDVSEARDDRVRRPHVPHKAPETVKRRA